MEDNAIDLLSRCQDPDGGHGGGPGQLPHLAATYAMVNSLITLGGDKALSSINRHKLCNFLLRMKVSSGGFRMHDVGEIDVRACYTAISVASILNILDEELTENVRNYILSCQTYEGGISGEPGTEAHGGYTFCELTTMILINESDRLDLLSLIDWMAFCQGVESGFQGRTNKLVDGCYSFWQGGTMALLQRLSSLIDAQQTTGRTEASVKFESRGGSASARSPAQYNLSDAGLSFLNRSTEADPFFDTVGLQRYILLCSQDPHGGLKDKPGKYRDYYQTCYCLSGLSVCQHSWSKTAKSQPLPPAISGPYTNLLEPCDDGRVCWTEHGYFARILLMESISLSVLPLQIMYVHISSLDCTVPSQKFYKTISVQVRDVCIELPTFLLLSSEEFQWRVGMQNNYYHNFRSSEIHLREVVVQAMTVEAAGSWRMGSVGWIDHIQVVDHLVEQEGRPTKLRWQLLLVLFWSYVITSLPSENLADHQGLSETVSISDLIQHQRYISCQNQQRMLMVLTVPIKRSQEI
ncbi:hypothetical protein MKX03_016519 [Papaver bracteatum]|nr:hypothetical protein MKX03_016519 [Papaver bracteatum]